LHPDVEHDGAAGTEAGFRYRIVYVDPALIRQALVDRELPFVSDPVHDQAPVTRAMASLLADLDEPIDDLRRSEIAATVADLLSALSGRRTRHVSIDLRAISDVRGYLAAHPTEQTRASVLEQLAGMDRFAIARQFRSAFGTSPDRYRTMRRLELARAAIERGEPLARTAAETGFADQSHMTRQFKRTYGLTPTRWLDLRRDAVAKPPLGPPLEL